MTVAIVRAGLEGTLKTYADANSLQIAWPNVPFVPPSGALYLRPWMLSGPTDTMTLEGSHRVYNGIFQVGIVLPVGVGVGSADAVVAGLSEIFRPETPIIKSGLRLYVAQPVSTAPPIQEPDGLLIPASFPYTCHTVAL